MKDLSIIIVSYKGWDRLRKCLGSLESFTGNQYNIEVLIVDNNSEDHNIYEIEKKFPEFTFIHNKVNGGFANGCNLGAKSAGGEFLLFLNPDTIATEIDIIKLLLAARQNPEYYIISCSQVNEKGKENNAFGRFPGICNMTGFQRSLNKIFKVKKSDENNCEIKLPDWVSGSVLMINKEIFRELNGFDEDFWMYYEDVDICRRIWNHGGKVAFFRNISIEHNHGGSSRINLKTASITKTEVLISKHLYINKHKSGVEKLIMQSFLVINNVMTGILLSVAGLLLFFIPKVFLRALIFTRLVKYYFGAIARLMWISPRSVNFGKHE
jgi:GT2 family glycosyltransferase